MRAASFSLVALLGCDPAEEVASHADSREHPAAWEWEDTATGAPALDPVALASDIEAQLAALYTVRATVPLDSFQAAYAYATASCPSDPVETVSETYGTTVYFDGFCDGNSVNFKGPGLYYTWDEQQINPVAALEAAGGLPPDIVWTGNGFNGQTDIYSDDGSLDFNCSCTMLDVVGHDPSGTSWFFGITQGTAHWTGPEAAGAWTEDPAVVPDLQIIANQNRDLRGIRGGGSLSGVGERYTAMFWHLELNASANSATPLCSPEGSLVLDYRDDADSRWYELTLAVDQGCQACGAAEDGSEVCVDLLPMLDFEETPWG